MTAWHNIHITDKSGEKFFKVVASPMSTESEIKNLKRHIDSAKKHPHMYKFLDVATMKIVLDGGDYETSSELGTDALLAELGI